MSLKPEEIAQAISGHRFAEAYPYLAPDVRWVLAGGPTLIGRDAVVEACEATAQQLVDVNARFLKFKTIADANAVVVDSLSEYEDTDGSVTVVASCDIYDFDHHEVIEITSYTVEVPPASESAA